MKRALKSAFRLLASAVGVDVARKGTLATPESALARLTRAGFAPATVLDIGVAEGTPWLYAAFPRAKYFLFEPLEEVRPGVERLVKSLRGVFFPVALGDRDGTIEIDSRREVGGSSIFPELVRRDVIRRYAVPIRRADSILSPSDFVPPTFCKIDVQGAELMVLRGMGDLLQHIDVIMVEVSILDTLIGAPLVLDVADYLRERRFSVFDVAGLGRRPLDGALTQADLIFVRTDCSLRGDKRWTS